MADSAMLTPVEDSDPCGDDLKWDMQFMTLMQEHEALFAQDRGNVVDGQAASTDSGDARDFIAKIQGLCGRTKDLRLLGVRAEALWRSEGLFAFAGAFEDLVAAAELWPDPETGIHPRKDEYDGDLGERVAPVARLLNLMPLLASTIGWGEGNPTLDQRHQAAVSLQAVFDAWSARLEPAFGDELPSPRDAWSAISKLIPASSSAADDQDGLEAAAEPQMQEDAWELVERAAELLATQDRHSPALPVLHLLLQWRSKGIMEIVDGMRQSGVTMEQLLESIGRQLKEG